MSEENREKVKEILNRLAGSWPDKRSGLTKVQYLEQALDEAERRGAEKMKNASYELAYAERKNWSGAAAALAEKIAAKINALRLEGPKGMNVHDEIDRFGEMNREAYGMLKAAQEREAKLQAEIDRLQRERDYYEGNAEFNYARFGKTEDEIAKLREQLAEIKRDGVLVCQDRENDLLEAEILKLRSVVERLREFIEYSYEYGYERNKAEKALAESADALGGK